MNKPPRGEELKRLNAHLNLLKVSAQDIPNMTVKVGPGNFWANGNSFIEFAGGNSPIITKPITGSKYVCVVITKFAQLAIIEGPTSATLAIEPALPQLNKDVLPLAIIYIKFNTTIITNDMIYDARPLFNLGAFKLNHSDLDSRNVADAHNIESITGLRTELDEKPTVNDINNLLVNKADNDGTTSNIFKLNKDVTGEPDEDTILEFHRGAESSAVIKYSEATQRLEFSNDGINYYQLSSVEDIYNKSEADLLLAAKADLANVYTKTEVDDLLENKADSAVILAEIDTRIANLINSAPETLDTLSELAMALNGDENFAATIATQINSKANTIDVYNKTEVDTLLEEKANLSDVIDSLDHKANATDLTALSIEVGSKANTADVYTKVDIDTSLEEKANVSNTYTKSEIDTLLIDTATMSNVSSVLESKADKANTYTKTEVDTALSYKASTNDILDVVDSRINGIIDAAPESLDTLNEIAIALGNDANLASTLTNQIATKANTADVNTALDSKADKTTVAADLLLKANTTDLAALTAEVGLKADALDVYTKTEIDTSLLTPKTIYVNKNRVDEYTSNGSMTKPFKTVQEALSVVSNLIGERIVIDIAPGIYEETFALTINNSSIRINLNEALLKGNFTLTDATTIVNTSGLKIVGMGVRSSYNNPNFKNNCIEGNFTYHTLSANNMQTKLDFVNSGVIGDITAIGGGKSRLWTFWTNSRWSGLMSATTGVNDCGIIVNAYNSNSSSSNSIGAATGKVAAYNLYNCVISGAWNVSITQSGTWRNVIWKSNSDFTGYTGVIDIDSNSAASFLSKASNISGITLTFADNASTVAYTPTNSANWTVQPTTVGEAIDRIAAALALLKGSSI